MSGKRVMPAKKAKKNKQNIERRRGFSLAEMLATMLILLMVSTIVAAGIPSAVRAYEKVTRSANAQMLLSTSVTALRSQLGTANRITVSSDNKIITYFNDNTGSYSKIYPAPSGSTSPGSSTSLTGVLMLQEYLLMPDLIAGTDSTDKQAITRQLVTNAAATKGLYITYDSISYSTDSLAALGEKGIVKIENLKVCLKNADGTFSGTPVTSIATLYIRPFGDMPTD